MSTSNEEIDTSEPPVSVPDSGDSGESGKLKMIVSLVKKCFGVKDIASMCVLDGPAVPDSPVVPFAKTIRDTPSQLTGMSCLDGMRCVYGREFLIHSNRLRATMLTLST